MYFRDFFLKGVIQLKKKKGLLLINLGTPTTFKAKHVYHYLNEFLTDPRVIDLSWFKRQLLVRGIIVPSRFRQSAKLYQKIWLKEGSPLLVHGINLQKKVQEKLGTEYEVVLAMRYKFPSIVAALEKKKHAAISEIIILPLFPQYASATTGSVHQNVMEYIKDWNVIPKLTFINSFPEHQGFIEALCERGKQYDLSTYDHILFSFHGLPERHIRKADCSNICLTKNCCQNFVTKNQFCYKAQCYATARAIAKGLNLQPDNYSICFQSRLGSEPWLEPYTSDVLAECAKKGIKRLLVFCPAFVSDCLETSCEISIEYAELFEELGGEKLQLVEGLNDHPRWVEAVCEMAKEIK